MQRDDGVGVLAEGFAGQVEGMRWCLTLVFDQGYNKRGGRWVLLFVGGVGLVRRIGPGWIRLMIWLGLFWGLILRGLVW